MCPLDLIAPPTSVGLLATATSPQENLRCWTQRKPCALQLDLNVKPPSPSHVAQQAEALEKLDASPILEICGLGLPLPMARTPLHAKAS